MSKYPYEWEDTLLNRKSTHPHCHSCLCGKETSRAFSHFLARPMHHRPLKGDCGRACCSSSFSCCGHSEVLFRPPTASIHEVHTIHPRVNHSSRGIWIKRCDSDVDDYPNLKELAKDVDHCHPPPKTLFRHSHATFVEDDESDYSLAFTETVHVHTHRNEEDLARCSCGTNEKIKPFQRVIYADKGENDKDNIIPAQTETENLPIFSNNRRSVILPKNSKL